MKKTFTFEALTREQIKDYCEASGDWNKIHHDEAFAKAAGLPSVIGHGMLSMGLAARALAELGYKLDTLKNFEAKFKDKTLPGDILTAEVVEETPTKIEIRLVNQGEVEVLTATAGF